MIARARGRWRRPRRSPGRSLALLVLVSVMAGGAPALASHESRSLVRPSRLDAHPARGIVLVITTGRTACTGFVVGQRKVVTAGHCLVRDAEDDDYRLLGSVPEETTLYRAYSRASSFPMTFPPCRVSRAWVHPRFLRSSADDQRFGSRAHDYAVLTTASGCGYPKDAILRMKSNTLSGGQMPAGTPVSLMGYPVDPRFDDMDGLHLWRSTGHVVSVFAPASRLYLTGFAAKGMSGAPVLRAYGESSPCGMRTCVTGILTECDVNDRGLCRLGLSPRGTVRITPEVRETILAH